MAFDLEGLLGRVPGSVATGENLEYDPLFAALERALAGKAEQQIGSTIVAAEPPDWARVEALSTELLLRSKDLRLAVPLACALAVRHGFAGFADGVILIRGLLERYWQAVHPELDPDDPTDAMMRVTALTGLCEPRLFSILRGAPLANSRSFGAVTWRSLHRSEGGGPPLEPGSVEAAFGEAGLEELRSLVQSIRGTRQDLEAIEAAFAAVRSGPDLGPLGQFLGDVLGILEPRLPLEEAVSGTPAAPGAVPAAVAGKRAFGGEVTSREDVLRAIDSICTYYATYEPSSPLPLLLGRCKRLVTMSFVEILKEMVPDALAQVRLIAGKTEE